MDLAQLDTSSPSGGVAMEVKHPTTGDVLKDGEEPVTITLVGADSQQYRDVQRSFQNARLRDARKPVTAEQLETQATATLAACTLGWSGIELDGQKLDCTVPNAKRLYARLPWLREQVDAFISERANFLPA